MPTIFVTTATGAIGSPLCHILCGQGWTVRATTRNLSSPIAQELTSIGVDLTEGDWTNVTALESAIQGCTHLFLNLFPDLANLTSELPFAQQILAIARKAGVKHLVYSSAFNGDGYTNCDDDSEPTSDLNLNKSVSNTSTPASQFFKTISKGKSQIERLIATYDPLFATYTILQPGYFMVNLLAPRVDFMYPGFPTTRIFNTALQPDTKLPMVDTHDIARFAAAALKDTENKGSGSMWNRQTILVYNEVLTPAELINILSKAVDDILGIGDGTLDKGDEWKVVFQTDEEVAQREEQGDLMALSHVRMRHMRKGIKLTVDEIQERWGVTGMSTFKEYLAREEDLVRKTYGQEGGDGVPVGGYLRA